MPHPRHPTLSTGRALPLVWLLSIAPSCCLPTVEEERQTRTLENTHVVLAHAHAHGTAGHGQRGQRARWRVRREGTTAPYPQPHSSGPSRPPGTWAPRSGLPDGCPRPPVIPQSQPWAHCGSRVASSGRSPKRPPPWGARAASCADVEQGPKRLTLGVPTPTGLDLGSAHSQQVAPGGRGSRNLPALGVRPGALAGACEGRVIHEHAL